MGKGKAKLKSSLHNTVKNYSSSQSSSSRDSPKPERTVHELLASRRSAAATASLRAALQISTQNTLITSSYGTPVVYPLDESDVSLSIDRSNAGSSVIPDLPILGVADTIVVTGAVPLYQEVRQQEGRSVPLIRAPAGPAAPPTWARTAMERRQYEVIRQNPEALSYGKSLMLELRDKVLMLNTFPKVIDKRTRQSQHYYMDDLLVSTLDPYVLDSNSQGRAPRSLKTQCLQKVAQTHLIKRSNSLHFVPFHLKQELMMEASMLAMQGRIAELKHSHFEVFVERDLTYLDLSYSAATSQTLSLFAPKDILGRKPKLRDSEEEGISDSLSILKLGKTEHATVKTESNELAPESWEDLYDTDTSSLSDSDEERTDTEAYNSERNMAKGCPNIHTIDLSFTNQKSLPGLTTARLLAESFPFLSVLHLVGCFDSYSGPQTLTILSRSLSQLLFLDLSFCSWMTDYILLSHVVWERSWSLLEVLCLLGCPLNSSSLIDIMRKRRPDLYIKVSSAQ
jgi:hypothetical protein